MSSSPQHHAPKMRMSLNLLLSSLLYLGHVVSADPQISDDVIVVANGELQ